jgi:16S rRNA (guanine527-N7)-methyltransferase
VSRNYVDQRLAELAAEHSLPAEALDQLRRLLLALAAEPDPHTTISDPAAAVDQHVADSLVALQLEPLRNARSVADIGSGAGFPALPLAIAVPDASFDLLESASRKVDLISRLVAKARIANAHAQAARAETWARAKGRADYDVVTARAVAPLAVLVEYAAPLLKQNGLLIAWKGARDELEESAGRKAADVTGMKPAGVRQVEPYRDARNLHLHLYLKQSPTPERFPRRPGMALKRPLA